MKRIKPEYCREEHLIYLDKLRESGVTNMFGAGTYVTAEYGFSLQESKQIVLYWMETFGERHPEGR